MLPIRFDRIRKLISRFFAWIHYTPKPVKCWNAGERTVTRAIVMQYENSFRKGDHIVARADWIMISQLTPHSPPISADSVQINSD